MTDRPRDDVSLAPKEPVAARASAEHLRDVARDARLLGDDEDGHAPCHATPIHRPRSRDEVVGVVRESSCTRLVGSLEHARASRRRAQTGRRRRPLLASRRAIAATAAHERGVRRLGDKCVRRRRLRGKRPGLPGPSRGVSRRDRRRARVVVRAPHDVRGAASAGATPARVRPIGRCTFVASFGEVPLPPSQLSLSPTLAASSTPARPLPSIPRRAAPNPTRSAPWPCRRVDLGSRAPVRLRSAGRLRCCSVT